MHLPPRVLAVAAVALLTFGTSLSPAAEPPLFTEQPLEAAINDATARGRLLLVVVSSNPQAAKAVETVWADPALRAWAQRHAVVVNLNDRTKIQSMTGAGLVMPRNGEPLVFRNGKMVRMFGSKPNAQGVPVPSNKEIKRDLSLLLRLQWTLEAQRAADEGWFQNHARNVQGVMSPAPAPIDPLVLIERARAWAAKSPAEAAGAMAELWAVVSAFDPAFEGVRLGSLAREMAALGAKDPEAMRRLRQLRAAEADRFDPSSFEGLFAQLVLDRVCGNVLDDLDFIDSSLNDPDSATLMPRATRIALELMLPRAHLNEPGPSDPTPWPRSLAAKLTSKADAKMKADEWSRLQAFRAWLLRVECSRAYGALLLAGREEHAAAVAEVLLKSENSPLNRRSLVAAAAANRQGREQHLTWLEGPTDNVVSTEALRAHVRTLLKKTDP